MSEGHTWAPHLTKRITVEKKASAGSRAHVIEREKPTIYLLVRGLINAAEVFGPGGGVRATLEERGVRVNRWKGESALGNRCTFYL